MQMFILSDGFFDQELLGNPLRSYVWVLSILLAGFVFKRYISKFLTRQLYRIGKKYATGVGPEKFIELMVAPFNLFIMLLIFYLAFDRLEYPQGWNLVPADTFGMKMIVFKTFLVLIVIAVTWIFLRLTDYLGLILTHRASLTDTKADDQLVPFIKESIKIIIALFSFMFMLGSVFHVNVASLIAGLGIGGLAVALAAKESLENLIGSFTIFLDKPFTIGDFIKVENITGHVEKIGFRSTRIRTPDKTFVTVPNKKVVDNGLENLTLRTSYRSISTIGITYEASGLQINSLIDGIKKMLEKENNIDNNYSVYFNGFTSNAIEILILYFVKTGEWEDFMKAKELINLKIMEIVVSNGCKFAYPTSRIILDKNSYENKNEMQ